MDEASVPAGRCKEVMRLTHNLPMARHLGEKKTHEIVKCHFTWPGMWKDIKAWCRTCPKCQLMKRNPPPPPPPPKAPLQEMPILNVPFEVLAFDLFGPFPRSTHGYKYVLTAMCLASKYPEAIPLKDIRAETVAENMMEIFSRLGMPRSYGNA